MTALPPAIIIEGDANAVSVARSLHRLGVKAYAINHRDAWVHRSRCVTRLDVPPEGKAIDTWAQYLLGPETAWLNGAVLLSCGDIGIQILARHREALLRRYKLDLSDPTAQIAVLDKLTTYQHAVAAGVPTPKFWSAESGEQVAALREQLVFPLIVKPKYTTAFFLKFGRKFLFARSFDELMSAFADAADYEVLLMEWIPGPDSLLCSYYTYLDERGEPLFHFTKRVIRRYPVGMGLGCCHVTDWIPELIEPSLKLFRSVGLRGLANIEYKLDPRDGQHKIMEVNARFTAANCLVKASGFDLAELVYNRITGRPIKPMEKFKSKLHLWDPGRDLLSFLEMRRRGEITFAGWLKDIARPQTFAYWNWTDPMPAVARLCGQIQELFSKKK